jgi:hypothetical protein
VGRVARKLRADRKCPRGDQRNALPADEVRPAMLLGIVRNSSSTAAQVPRGCAGLRVARGRQRSAATVRARHMRAFPCAIELRRRRTSSCQKHLPAAALLDVTAIDDLT